MQNERSSFFAKNFFSGYAYKTEDYFRGGIGRSIILLLFSNLERKGRNSLIEISLRNKRRKIGAYYLL